MKPHLLVAIIFFSISLVRVRVMAGPFSDCELVTRGLTSENLEFVDTAATFKLAQETGIQILTIKRALQYQTAKYPLSLKPIGTASDKFELAEDVTKFLNAFPKDFLLKVRDMCFILVEDTQNVEAMTTKNTIFLPIDASYEAMAHEFMHAVDDLYEKNLNYENWDVVSGDCRYDSNININQEFPAGSIDNQCFISPYAKTDLWEDRAEIFSALYRNQMATEQAKPIKDKVSEVKQFLKSISPYMNENFWNSQRNFSW